LRSDGDGLVDVAHFYQIVDSDALLDCHADIDLLVLLEAGRFDLDGVRARHDVGDDITSGVVWWR